MLGWDVGRPLRARWQRAWRPVGHSGERSVSVQATMPTSLQPTARSTGEMAHSVLGGAPGGGGAATSSLAVTSGPAGRRKTLHGSIRLGVMCKAAGTVSTARLRGSSQMIVHNGAAQHQMI